MASGSVTSPLGTEIAVIGGGIAGLSTALFLARDGAEVTVIERAEPWSEASGANAGTLSLQVKIIPVLALARYALDLWESLRGIGIETGFARPGGLRVATSEVQLGELRRYAERQAIAGVKTDWLEGQALREMLALAGRLRTGGELLCRGRVHEPAADRPIPRRGGAACRGPDPVGLARHIDRAEGRGLSPVLPRASCTAASSCWPPGPWTAELGAMLGVKLPLYVDVNMLSVTEPAPPLIDRVITHIGGVLSLKQHRNGTILIGGGWQGRGGFSPPRKEIDHERLMQNLKEASSVVPGAPPVEAGPQLGRLRSRDGRRLAFPRPVARPCQCLCLGRRPRRLSPGAGPRPAAGAAHPRRSDGPADRGLRPRPPRSHEPAGDGTMRSVEIAVIGAGPAGLAATAEAVACGAKVTLIDDNRQPGGQYFRQISGEFRRKTTTVFDKDQPRAEALLRIINHAAVDYMPETTVWSLGEDRVVGYSGPQGSGRLAAGCLILCPGAHDRPVPFPGWTLPGVVTAGGLQNLVKEQRMLPGRRAVVAGNGPLLLVTAASLLRGGAQVAEVIEAAPLHRRLLPLLPALAASPKILRLAISYRLLMMRHGVPMRSGETVIEALGEGHCRQFASRPSGRTGEFCVIEHERSKPIPRHRLRPARFYRALSDAGLPPRLSRATRRLAAGTKQRSGDELR